MSKKLYDPIRGVLVAATPEECVRQALLKEMLDNLGYPKGLISVEKALPNRRFDILVHRKAGDALQPLLLIECKAVPITQATLNQVIGYNHHIQAPYLAVANQKETRCGWFNGTDYHFEPGLPDFNSLLDSML